MMRKIAFGLMMVLAVTLLSCGNDSPISEDELKTNELRSKYNDKVVGSWFQEKQTDANKVFEQLHFTADGKVTGYGKWLHRNKVSVGGEEVWTDWETEEDGELNGTWYLFWKDGQSWINIYATISGSNYVWYSGDYKFNEATDEYLDFESPFWFINDNTYTTYEKGVTSPSF